MHPRASALIHLLDLTPHPEGGYYCEVFRSARMVRPSDSTMERAAITTIYFLLVAGQHSRWHRVTADEIWHHYEGDPLELIWLDAAKTVAHRDVLGPATEKCRPVQIVPAGSWQAARSLGEYTLMGVQWDPASSSRTSVCLPMTPRSRRW